MNTNYPKCRTDEIVVQELNGEILIYDLRDNRAMCLNETSSAVWRACDGSNSVADIAKTVGNEDLVWLALTELKNERLVNFDDAAVTFTGISRREVIKKIGLGTAVAIPLISSLVAPPAASAASCAVVSCNGNGQCNGQPVGCRTCNDLPSGGGRVCGP